MKRCKGCSKRDPDVTLIPKKGHWHPSCWLAHTVDIPVVTVDSVVNLAFDVERPVKDGR